jgi:putative transposase
MNPMTSERRGFSRDLPISTSPALLERCQDLYPSAMKSFTDDLEACWAHLRCPTIHHKRIRTTNLLQRAFGEQKRRTKVIPRFMTERSCLKPVFATLWQVSKRWHGVRMSEFEQQQFIRLRAELDLMTKAEAKDALGKVA